MERAYQHKNRKAGYTRLMESPKEGLEHEKRKQGIARQHK